jgi:hypothetical protein
MRRNPTPIAPEETMTTRWPSACSLHAVSTMRERIDSKGWCVFSSTIDDVPVHIGKLFSFFQPCHVHLSSYRA